MHGLYRLPIGKRHALNFGGRLLYLSGEPWARTENINVLGGTETMTVFAEPRGSRRNPDHKELSLSFEWQFPIVSRVDVSIQAGSCPQRRWRSRRTSSTICRCEAEGR